jgi:hypothetical protein
MKAILSTMSLDLELKDLETVQGTPPQTGTYKGCALVIRPAKGKTGTGYKFGCRGPNNGMPCTVVCPFIDPPLDNVTCYLNKCEECKP